MATTPAHMDYLRTNHAKQVSLGLKTAKLLTGDEIRAMYPQLRGEDIIGGSFCSTDGFVDPYSAMNGFMVKAAELGAKLWRDCEVTSIERDAAGAVAAIDSTKGKISSPVVVNAAGAWAAGIAAMAGVELPVQPLRRMLVPTEPFDEFPHSAPMIIDMSTGFHFRPEGRGFLLAWNDAEETPGYKLNFEPSFIEKILVHAADRVPCFEHVPVNPKRAWAGLYEMTPDHHPIIGPAPGVKGFFFANGFSGHGVMHAPATGRLTADLILRGTSEIISDPQAFALERFAEGRAIHETAVL